MQNKILTLVTSEILAINEILKFLKGNLNLNIIQQNQLSVHSTEFYIQDFEDEKYQNLHKELNDKKIDFCLKDESLKNFKILLCDMDATMIANETLDDLVKISGSDFNVDETSKLAMEGKIDLRTTLKTRVEILKGKPKSLIDEVVKGIQFNSAGKTLVQTCNQLGLETNLITGGFKPISTYVGKYFGFKNVISNEFNFDKNDCFTGDYIPITGEKNSKYKYMEKLSNENKVDFSEMVSVGDGSNDLQMLKHSGLGIGYHAHQIIKDNIKTQIQYTDLTTVLYFLGIKKDKFIN